MTDRPDPDGPEASPADGPTPAELKRAMKAFRKRLKLMRLDDESGLGGGSMTGGRESDIVAIPPPSGYSNEVWEKLVELGRLRDAGHGNYELGEG